MNELRKDEELCHLGMREFISVWQEDATVSFDQFHEFGNRLAEELSATPAK